MICKICNFECETIQKFNNHLKNHNLNSKSYYDLYLKTNNDGFCVCCNKPTNWINFIKGYRKYCSKKCASIYALDKRTKTNLKKYGVENVFQSNDIKEKIKMVKNERYGNETFVNPEKIKQTTQERYNVDNVSQIKTVNDTKIQTSLKHYGVMNPMQSEQIKEKRIKNNFKKYNVDSTNKLETTKLKYKQTCLSKYGTEYACQSNLFKEKHLIKLFENYNLKVKKNGYNGNVIDYDNNKIKYICNDCHNISDYSIQTFSGRLYEKVANPCLICNPLHKCYSDKEKELFNYIKSIYNGVIVENDRTTLNGKEIDIYLPDLKIGFEFDGTYWHADPRFYCATDLINENKAIDIWEKDKLKDELCKTLNIKLYRVKEYDWINDNENIKKLIFNIINNVNIS